jgi:hypothetical protein
MKSYLRLACTRAGVLLLAAGAGCAPPAPALQQTGTLAPGGVVSVTNLRGNISIYAPARGQSPTAFTLTAAGADARRDVIVRRARNRITITTHGFGSDLLLRGSKGTVMDVAASRGNINAADFEGVVHAGTDRGDIKMLLPQYGTAYAGTGNISVTFAGTTWPGTLHFFAGKGDVELYVNQNAAARIRLRALHGTIFTDFPLKGTARGSSEEIDGAINGGAKRAIDVFVRDGSIRLLQLKPQM